MVITGCVVEHREEAVYVTLLNACGWVVWLINPETGLRTVVEDVQV